MASDSPEPRNCGEDAVDAVMVASRDSVVAGKFHMITIRAVRRGFEVAKADSL